MEYSNQASSIEIRRVAIFDMDNTLLRHSFIYSAAEEFGFSKELTNIVTTQSNPFIRTRLIAGLLKGKHIRDLLRLADEIPVADNTQMAMDKLRGYGFITGIVSDSYDFITNHMKNRFSLDFSLGNKLKFSQSVATGEIEISSFYLPHGGSICTHEYCKTHALAIFCRKFNTPVSGTLAVGDSGNDICIIRKSGIGISFCSTNSLVDNVADFVLKEPDFNLLIPIIQHDLRNKTGNEDVL